MRPMIRLKPKRPSICNRKTLLIVPVDIFWVENAYLFEVNSELWPRWTVERRREVALELLPYLKTSELVFHTYPFEKVAEAYELIDKHPEETMQVVLEYH